MSKDVNVVLLDLFVHGQQWIPNISLPGRETSRPVIILYKGNEYVITNDQLLRWFQDDDVYNVDQSVFVDIIGYSPDVLPTSSYNEEGYFRILDELPIESKENLLDIMTLLILLNYVGAYGIAWKLQRSIYSLREYLPVHWKDLGGIHVSTTDVRMKKWIGSVSPYMRSQYNGMYVPYGISEMASHRFILINERSSHLLTIVASKHIQDLSFGLTPHIQYIDDSLLDAISLVGTGKYPPVLPVHTERQENIVATDHVDHPIPVSTTGIREDMTTDEITEMIMKDPQSADLIISSVPMESLSLVADSLIEDATIESIIESWNLYTFCCNEKKERKITNPLVKVIESNNTDDMIDMIDTMEDMTEEELTLIANVLSISIPYEDGDIVISDLINLIHDKVSVLIK